jgi:hypothetical protein
MAAEWVASGAANADANALDYGIGLVLALSLELMTRRAEMGVSWAAMAPGVGSALSPLKTP